MRPDGLCRPHVPRSDDRFVLISNSTETLNVLVRPPMPQRPSRLYGMHMLTASLGRVRCRVDGQEAVLHQQRLSYKRCARARRLQQRVRRCNLRRRLAGTKDGKVQRRVASECLGTQAHTMRLKQLHDL